MPLGYDKTKILDWEDLEEGEERGVTETCIFTALYIGMPSITPANWAEWYQRTFMWERCFGSRLSEHNNVDGYSVTTPRYITAGDVARRIGLKTNAPTQSEIQYKNRIYDILQGKAIAALQNDEEAKWLLT